jgi:signal transduction histidine kinase
MKRLRLKYWQRESWVYLTFWVILVFLIAQVIWWMIFQRNLIQQNLDYAQTSWLREAVVVQKLLLVSSATQRADLTKQLQTQFPHLQIEGNKVQIDPERLAAFRYQQLQGLRMLAFEGPFFLVVMLIGLWIIARSFRREQDFKRRQQNFLLSATHEFRTPIGTLRLLLDTMKIRELLPEKRASYLLSMGQELSRLEDLSERLLVAARVDQGLLPVHVQQRDLSQAVAEKLNILAPALEARGAKLHFEPAKKQLPIDLDSEAFSLVLSNLLENALKYSPDVAKPIWIRVLDQGKQALIQIEDRGVGVTKDSVHKLFDPFFRAGNELTRETRGIGLGLYLVKSLMELMNGSVSCEPLEKGTRFILKFPLTDNKFSPLAKGNLG